VGEPDLPDLPEEPEINPDEYDDPERVEFNAIGVPERPEDFPMGVASGAMQHDRFLAWTFVEDRRPRRLRVWREQEQRGVVLLVHDQDVMPDEAGYLKAWVDDLAPFTQYRFAFFEFDEQGRALTRSELGRTKTALPPGSLRPVTIGASACTNFRNRPYLSIGAVANEPIDLFVHLGDMSYNDAANDLDSYRELWRQTLTEPNYRQLMSSVGFYGTWDDHEIENNLNPEFFNPSELAAAKRAFFETLPVEQGAQGQLWTSYQWGDTLEVFVLDSRTERKPTTRNFGGATYISPEQLAWLQRRLLDTTARFKVILSSVPITNMPPLWISEDDRWEGYQAQRDQLLGFIDENNIRNVWFLAGDFHVGFAGRVEPSGDWARMWEVAVGPGASGSNPLTALSDGGLLDPELVFPSGQFAYGSGRTQVLTTLTFDPRRDEVRVYFEDVTTGEVLFDEALSEGQ
jgi:alkaline phosphatase D